MEDYTQGIPPVRTMPTAPVQPSTNRTAKITISILLVLALLGGAFAIYWFFYRAEPMPDQQKFDILEALKESSTNDFTPEQKEQALTNLEAQSNASNPGVAAMSEEEKMEILNSLGQ